MPSTHPKKLLSYKRIDVIPKYLYAIHKDKGITSKWAENLYKEHIKVFNGGFEKYPEKNSVEDFLKHFDKLLDSIKNKGFDKNSSISIDKENILLHGSHRFGASLAYNLPVFYKYKNKKAPNYNPHYFKNKIRYVSSGLDQKWLDVIALEYCKLKKNTYGVTVFPSAESNEKEVKKILDKYGEVFYEKKVLLNNHGPLNLIRQMYSEEKWLGNSKNNFKGGKNKVNNCFRKNKHTWFLLFESENLKKVKKAKQELRDIFRIGKHSVHINDEHKDTVKLAKVFLNKNSIHFLNNCKPKYFNNFYNLFKEFRSWIKQKNLNPEEFCITGSSVLSIYGIRDCNDLDFFHFPKKAEHPHDKIKSHNKETKHYEDSVDDIIFNPENHFWFNGIKFASLNIIKKMKEKRKELKDIIDLRIINEFISTDINSCIKYNINNPLKRVANTKAFQKISYVVNRLQRKIL